VRVPCRKADGGQRREWADGGHTLCEWGRRLERMNGKRPYESIREVAVSRPAYGARGFAAIGGNGRASDASFAIKNLRTRELRPLRELREACIFCYGMTECTAGPKFLVAHAEEQDYDAVATWNVDDCQNFAPIQIKEIVPHKVNLVASVQEVVAGLQKYVNSEDLTVAIHLNRTVRGFNPAEIVVPPLKVAALWIFGAIAADQSRWAIWGNFLDVREACEFTYPS
jgi:hypothetical protein